MDISRFPVRVHKSGAGGLGHCAQCDVGGGLSQRVSALGAFLGGGETGCGQRAHHLAHASCVGADVLGQDLAGQVRIAVIQIDQRVHC